MKKVILCLLFLTFSLPIFADSKKIEVFVSGMACSDCFAKVKGNITKYPQVESADINPDDGLCTIILKEGKSLCQKSITKAVTKAGFEVKSFK